MRCAGRAASVELAAPLSAVESIVGIGYRYPVLECRRAQPAKTAMVPANLLLALYSRRILRRNSRPASRESQTRDSAKAKLGGGIHSPHSPEMILWRRLFHNLSLADLLVLGVLGVQIIGVLWLMLKLLFDACL